MSALIVLRRGLLAVAAVAALAISGAAPAAHAAARSPGPAAAPGLRVTGTVNLGKVSDPFTMLPTFGEAPDGDVYYGRGSVVYVVRGDRAPAAVLRAAGPVLAVAANSADIFVAVKAKVTAYRRSNRRPLRSWILPSPFPVTSAGLYAVGGTVWAWTDWQTGTQAEFANVDRFSPSSGTVHRVSTGIAYPGVMAADAAGLYYQAANFKSGVVELLHVTPSGSVRSSLPVPTLAGGLPVALAGGNAELLAYDWFTSTTYLIGCSGSTLATVFGVPVPSGVTDDIAGTGAGLLMLTGDQVSVMSPASGHAGATLTLPKSQYPLYLVPGPSAVVITYNDGRLDLVRLAGRHATTPAARPA